MTYDSSSSPDEQKTSSDEQKASSNVVPFPGDVQYPHVPTVPSIPSADALPAGYRALPDGIYYLEQDDLGDEHPVHLCSTVAVIGLCRRSDSKGWGRVVDVVDPDHRTHRVLLDEPLFNSAPAALLRPLLDLGLQIDKGANVKKRLVELLGAWRPKQLFVRVSRAGWVDDDFDTFALADGSIVGRKESIFDQDIGTIGKAARAKGSLEIWRDTIAAPCAGNPLMLLAVSQAFVGPLLAPLGLDGGGFHFRGASSCGKTTLLRIAASVWGAPGYVQSWRATDNALESAASSCSSALLALDELHQVSPKVAGDIIYMLANGQGKRRMTPGGKAGSCESWHVALLSNGEISLEEHMASAGKKTHAGQEIRLIDIQADGRRFGAFDHLHGETDARLFAEQLKQAAADGHGVAGRLFIERLTGNINRLGNMEKVVNHFIETEIKTHNLHPEGQMLRVLKRFAVAALAGELATTWGLTGWNKGEALAGIFDVCGSWIKERDAASAGRIAAVLERTRMYLSANPNNFSPLETDGGVDGWREDGWFYIRPEAWSRIHGAEGAEDVARLHKAANMLRTDKGQTLQWRMGRNTPGRPRVYAVSIRVLDA